MVYIRLLILLSIPFLLTAQNSGVPLGSEAYQIMERLEIKIGVDAPFHAALKYYARGDVANYALAMDTLDMELSELDRRDLQYIFNDNNEWLERSEWPATLAGERQLARRKVYVDSTKTFYTFESNQAEVSKKSDRYVTREKPIFGLFYKTPANAFELDQRYFHLRLNPIINFRMAQTADDGLTFLNQRGVSMRGGIDDRIYFYTRILENQARFPDYVRDYVSQNESLPGSGLFKSYESSVFDIDNGYDYLNAQGYVGFNISKHVGIQLGHGRNFIGHGYRSLLLSDFADNMFYLKMNTRIWKFHYQNIFTELNASSQNSTSGGNLIPKKYMAAHYLSLKPNSRFSIGLYEAVVFQRDNQFELQYLNPIIFYRTIEHGLDSPDNVLIGLDVRWDAFKRLRLYSQLMLDEFDFKELIVERRGWWANKFGFQLGAKYIDALGVDHLDVGIEFNTARPYTYVHRDSLANYTHQFQPLAHPLGANFKETLLTLRYEPIRKLVANLLVINATTGRDEEGTNWGSDLQRSYVSREIEFGNETKQGVATKINIVGLNLSYQLFHNGYAELYYQYRKIDSALNERDNTTSYFGAGFRMNIQTREHHY